MSDLSSEFEQAVRDSKAVPEKPDNPTLLKIYGLYKQATAGDATGERPGLTDFVARAKWDAWHACAGQTRELGMRHYIDLIASLG